MNFEKLKTFTQLFFYILLLLLSDQSLLNNILLRSSHTTFLALWLKSIQKDLSFPPYFLFSSQPFPFYQLPEAKCSHIATLPLLPATKIKAFFQFYNRHTLARVVNIPIKFDPSGQ